MTQGSTRSVTPDLERLCGVLEGLVDALTSLDAAGLLASEVALADLTRTLGAARAVDVQADVPALVERARAALRRCRQLGDSFGTVAGARLGRHPGSDGYGRDGAYVRPGAGPSSIHAVT